MRDLTENASRSLECTMHRSYLSHYWLAALSAALLVASGAGSAAAETQSTAGIVDGPSLCLAGTRAFSFIPSSAGGTVQWSLDRETVSGSGVHTRNNGILTRSGASASFPLPAVSGSETIYYVNAHDAGASDGDTVQVFPANDTTWFTYRSPGNPDVRVYCIIPSSLSGATRVLLALHGNMRTAAAYSDDWRAWAAQHDYIVLCPYYDLAHWPTDGTYQEGNVFSADDCGGSLNPESRWSFTIDEGIHERVRAGFLLNDPLFDLWGFSGGGQHVHRFMAFKPNAEVRLAIAAGSGWYTAPDLNIDCPYGLSDPLLHFTKQDLVNWTDKRMVIMVGTADTLRDVELRVTPAADAEGLNRYQRAGYMVAKGRALNPSTHWQRVDVPGVGHSAAPMAAAAQAFLAAALLDVPKPADVSSRTMLRVWPNPVVRGTALRGAGWAGDEVRIGVYDLAGRAIAARTAHVVGGEWRSAWSSLSGQGSIAPGIYLVRVRDDTRHAEQKVLVLE